MVHAEHDDGLLQAADDETADAKRQLQERGDRAEDRELKRMHDRADDEQAEQHGEKEREERRHDEVDDVRHDGLELLLQLRGEDAEHERWEHRALIADDGHLDAEDVHRDGLRRTARDRVGVRQLRRDEHEAEHDADDRRAAEALRRRPADERRQERECRIRENAAHAQHVLAELEPQALRRAAQAHEKTGRDEHGDDGYEDVAERARNLLHERHLRVGFLLVAHAGEIRPPDELREHLVDEARAKDDLVLRRREELPLHALDILDGLLIDLALVIHDEAQTRRAVLGVADILHAADVLLDELCDALLVGQVVKGMILRVRRRGCSASRGL